MSGVTTLPCGGTKLETDDFIIYSMIASESRSGLLNYNNYTVKQNISRIIFSIGGMFINISGAKYYHDASIGSEIILYDSNNERIINYYRTDTITWEEQSSSGTQVVWNETHIVNKYVEKIRLSLITSSATTSDYTNASYASVVLIKQK